MEISNKLDMASLPYNPSSWSVEIENGKAKMIQI